MMAYGLTYHSAKCLLNIPYICRQEMEVLSTIICMTQCQSDTRLCPC